MRLDSIDRKILALLQEKGNMSNLDLAEQVNLSPSACSRRVKSLEENGIIGSYVALLNPKRVGLGMSAFVSISMEAHESPLMIQFEKTISKLPEVVQCHLTAGQAADYFLKVLVRDLEEYQSFLLNKLTKIPGVKGVQSVFILKDVVEKSALPLTHA